MATESVATPLDGLGKAKDRRREYGLMAMSAFQGDRRRFIRYTAHRQGIPKWAVERTWRALREWSKLPA